MKKLFTILAVAMCSTLAIAQTNQYFWAGGQFIMGNPINQIDSITFGQIEQTDSVLLYLPRTVKVIHDTVIQYVTIHDTINPCAVPDGAISGKFSVSPTKQVYFSKGNLQYNRETNIWKFADNQYDYIGKDNVLNPRFLKREYYTQYNGQYYWQGDALGEKTDFFAWSSDVDPNRKWGLESSKDDNDKFNGNFIDWGININESWYTMSKGEWNYLISERPNANDLIAVGTVNNVNGCIILPDEWKTPKQLEFNAGKASSADSLYYSTINNYSVEEWKIMEAAGAVFLPASGGDLSLTYYHINTVNIFGAYWCSSKNDSTFGCIFTFDSSSIYTTDTYLYIARAVRLVQEVK